MKKPEELAVVYADNIEELMEKYDFIGFMSDIKIRYMVVACGGAKGLAVTPDGTYAGRQEQKNNYPMESYRVFDSGAELLLWMSQS